MLVLAEGQIWMKRLDGVLGVPIREVLRISYDMHPRLGFFTLLFRNSDTIMSYW
jgi:hypothetical protein